jgi:nitrogen fixation/metabolism regulation signal transduction histidine kinase
LRDEREILLADGGRQRAPGEVPSGRPEWGWDGGGALLVLRFALESNLAGEGVHFVGERRLAPERVAGQLAGVVGAPVRVEPFLPGRRYPSDDIVVIDARGEAGGDSASTIVLEIDSAAPGRLAEAALRSELRRVMLVSGAVAAALALLLAEVLVRPLRRLTGAVTRVAGGEPPEGPMPSGSGEVSRLASAVDAMIASLRAESLRRVEAERRGAWRDVARRVAHEVRNPLSPIRLAVDNVRRARTRGVRELGESLDAELPAIEAEVARLDRLVREFSEYARLPSPEPRPVRLAEFVEPAVRGQVPDPERITVDVRIEDGLERPVLVDPVLLGQALANLARNAVEAIGEQRGAIRVRCRPGPPSGGRSVSGIVIEVSDDGPGIPGNVRDSLFDPYVSGRGSSGLGLAITRRVIAEHGGTITVDEPPGGGARFVIALPGAGPQRGES